jgi:hypothetical protein
MSIVNDKMSDTLETDKLDCASFEREILNLSRLASEEYLLRLWLGKTSAPVSIFELWKVEEELVEARKHGNVMPEHWLTKSYAANRNELKQLKEEAK